MQCESLRPTMWVLSSVFCILCRHWMRAARAMLGTREAWTSRLWCTDTGDHLCTLTLMWPWSTTCGYA